MAKLDFNQFYKVITSGKVDSFYTIVGEDPYLLDEGLKLLKRQVLTPGMEDFNYDVFYAKESEVQQIQDALDTLPMMGLRRLVLLKNAEELKSKELEKLLELVSAPYDNVVFAIVFQKVDKRKKIFKDLFKKVTAVEFKPPHEKIIPQWVNSIAKKYGKTIKPEAISLLQQYVGSQLIDLDNEIRKMSLYVGERKVIERSDIEAVVSKTKLESVFEFTKCLGQGQREKALYYLNQLITQGESEVGLLAMMTRHFRLLAFAKEAHAQRLSKGEASKYIGVPTFFVSEYLNQANLWSDQKLQDVYGSLLKADRSLKSISISPRYFLENFVTEACHI